MKGVIINMQKKWWQNAVVYQIYPKSFKDSNKDGIGDLTGIIEGLDYIRSLGVNVIWLCPVNRSPMRDNGYDISDYYTIDPLFGTNADLERLIKEAKTRGIKVLMDLVVNHVSSEHKWFLDMLADENSPFRDYFIIRETQDGNPPNNFRSYFGDSVWTRIGDSNRFYFHSFAKEQPDLNWENPRLRQEIYDMMSYWSGKGIAGFRVDAIGNIKKSAKILSFCHMPPDAGDGMADSHDWLLNQPGINVFLSEMRDRVFHKYDSMTVAEVSVPDDQLAEYVGENGYFSMVFDFSYTDIDVNGVTTPCDLVPWNLENLKGHIYHSQEVTQKIGWAAPYLENHDQPRSVNKYLPDGAINDYNTKMLGALFFFLRGTPYIYQGQELGMQNYPFTRIEQFADEGALKKYEMAAACGEPEEKIMDYLRRRSRDNGRTPMQWSDDEYAGFSSESPWLSVNPDYTWRNVRSQNQDDLSILQFYRRMVWLRLHSAYRNVLTYGMFEGLRVGGPEDFVYRRYDETHEVLVILNYSETERPYSIDLSGYEILLNNYAAIPDISCPKAARGSIGEERTLLPWQVLVVGKEVRQKSC